MEQRISTNEETVAQVLDYFKEIREQNQQHLLNNSHQHLGLGSHQHGFPLSYNQAVIHQNNYNNQIRADLEQIKQNAI